MVIAKFASTTECHNQLSKLLQMVSGEDAIVFITRHGAPSFALLSVSEAPEDAKPEQFLGIRELAKEFHQRLKQLEEWEVLYITSHKKPVAQLSWIEPDDVDDMILLANRQLQAEAEKYSTPEAAESLMSGSELLNELKALRGKVSS